MKMVIGQSLLQIAFLSGQCAHFRQQTVGHGQIVGGIDLQVFDSPRQVIPFLKIKKRLCVNHIV